MSFEGGNAMLIKPTIVIIGAGKIGRGFIGHLLFRSGYPFVFIESNPAIAEGLAALRRYHIAVTGTDEFTEISGFSSYHSDDPKAREVLMTASTIFTAVGGSRIRELGLRLGPIFAERLASSAPLQGNLITCENWVHPAQVLRDAMTTCFNDDPALAERARRYLGVAEATVLRSCIEPTAEQKARDPFTVRVQNYWQLQVDHDALVTPLPEIFGVVTVPNFQRALERKLYTYNAASATMSFLGVLVGHRYLHEAAHDPRILAIAQKVLQETGQAVCRQYGYSPEEQAQFAARAIQKYQDRNIPDTLERNVRDPIRKLGRSDRLVGAARLCMEAGVEPRGLALAIAAGLRYHEPSDPSAERLKRMTQEIGLDGVFREVLGIDPESDLARLIKTRISDVDRFVSGQGFEEVQPPSW